MKNVVRKLKLPAIAGLIALIAAGVYWTLEQSKPMAPIYGKLTHLSALQPNPKVDLMGIDVVIGDPIDFEQLKETVKSNKIVLLRLTTANTYPFFSDIFKGKYNRWITHTVNALNTFEQDVWIQPLPDVNVSHLKWSISATGQSPRIIQAANQYLQDKIRKIAGTNIKLGWGYHVGSLPIRGWNNPFLTIPQDAEVDFILLSGNHLNLIPNITPKMQRDIWQNAVRESLKVFPKAPILAVHPNFPDVPHGLYSKIQGWIYQGFPQKSPQVTAAASAERPVITISESASANAVEIAGPGQVVSGIDTWANAQDLSAKVSVSFKDRHLYIIATVTDDDPLNAPHPITALDQDDSIELLLKPETGASEHWGIHPTHGIWDLANLQPVTGTVKHKTTATGYILISKIQVPKHLNGIQKIELILNDRDRNQTQTITKMALSGDPSSKQSTHFWAIADWI